MVFTVRSHIFDIEPSESMQRARSPHQSSGRGSCRRASYHAGAVNSEPRYAVNSIGTHATMSWRITQCGNGVRAGKAIPLAAAMLLRTTSASAG
jgi:hypothetical protein